MAFGVISEIGYISMHTSDIVASVQHAKDILGLVETGRSGNAVYMASATKRHHDLVYIDAPRHGVGQIGLIAANPAALDIVRTRVRDAGYPIISQTPLHPGVADGFAFIGPEDFIFEIYVQPERVQVTLSGFTPNHFGHVNLHPVDVAGMLRFFRDILEFRVSDAIGEDFAYFLRCNSEHHGIGIIKGRGWMHHHAWQLGSIAELAQIADRLYEHDERLLMGITRHGAGRNLAAYYVEPTGAVVELYTDMEHIYDDDRPAVHWTRDNNDFATLWAPYDMTEFRSHGLFPAVEAIVAQ